jgi:hypothetical protein
MIRSRVDMILKVLEYPKCGNVGDWESSLAAIIYLTEDEPSQPWDNIMAEYFEFARVNLICGFTKQRNVTAYERVRTALSAAGVEASPFEELQLGRVSPAEVGTRR